MSKLKNIRFIAYIVVVVSMYMLIQRTSVIPLNLPELACTIDDSSLDFLRQWSGSPNEFAGAKLTLGEVLKIATKEGQGRGIDTGFRISGVSLQKLDGRLIWIVSFVNDETMNVSIDDATAAPRYRKNEKSEPNKAAEPTAIIPPPSATTPAPLAHL